MATKLMSHQATIFSVPDVRKALDFYRDQMGFNLEFAWEDPPSYAVLQRDDSVTFHLSQNPDPQTARGLAYVFVYDPDALYHEFIQKGIDIPVPPADQDYGMRDFDVADPWGNRITFGKGLS